MQVPSPGQSLVALQKAVTRLHIAFLRSPLGAFPAPPGARFLILHTVGRRSGQERVTPLSFTKDADSYVLIASNGGAPRHPDWYLNLDANPAAEIEVRGRRKPVRAETVTGPERERLWKAAVASYAGYAAYQRRAEREIPVVRLHVVEPAADQ
jgi:deazaflavin-dependent oxidoreductase (nitroreductase family)